MPKAANALKKEENDSESETSSSSEESEEKPVKKVPAKAAEKEEEGEEESDTESDSSSMTKQTAAKATTTTATPKTPSSSKRGRDDKSEAESDAKKLKAQENGSKSSKKQGAAKKAGEEDEDKTAKKGRKQKKEDGEKSASEAEKQEEKSPHKLLEEPKRKHNSGWSAKDESLLAQKMLEDLKGGLNFHDRPKTDSYWTDLWESLKGKFSHDYTKDQVFEKHRRMKAKFDKLEKGDKDPIKSVRKRSNAEDALHAVFKQLWGKEAAAAPDVGEESQDDMDTSEPPVRKEEVGKEVIAPENGEQQQQQLSRLTTEALSRVSMLGADPLMGICSSLCAGIQSLVRFGIGVDSKASREVRKRILEEQISEYSDMNRRLKLMIDYCQLEEQLLQKKLSSLDSSKH